MRGDIVDILFSIAFILVWMGGIVIAKGGHAFVALIFPPYGWYLIVERLMTQMGWA